MATAPIYTSTGAPTILREGALYTVVATINGTEHSDIDITTEAVRAALVNAPRLGITITRVIEQGAMLSATELAGAFRNALA